MDCFRLTFKKECVASVQFVIQNAIKVAAQYNVFTTQILKRRLEFGKEMFPFKLQEIIKTYIKQIVKRLFV